MNRSIPIKITSEEFANDLLSGKVYMSVLSKFGVWNKTKNKDLDNSFRGDLHEGAVKTFGNLSEAEPGIDPRFAKVAHNVTIVDDTELKYLKIFCLYGLRWCAPSNFFIRPDDKIKQFGDTAVVFTQFDEFLKRLYKVVADRFGDRCLFLIDDVDYFDYGETKELYPGYSKHKSYSWQNEIRVAVAKLEKNVFAINQKPDEYSMVLDDKDLIVDIGDINDIAYKMPIDDFLHLKLNKPLQFPMNSEEPKSFTDHVAKETKKSLRNYKTTGATLLVTI